MHPLEVNLPDFFISVIDRGRQRGARAVTPKHSPAMT